MVKRYRNSPSIILWSIGNEEWQLQNEMAEQGAKIARHHGAAAATNSIPRAWSRPPSTATTRRASPMPLDIIGFNYNLKFPDEYPQEASQAADLRLGDVERDLHARSVLDRHAAQHGELPTTAWCRWGETAEEWWKFYGTREWEAGGFAWTGFDYRGEPTPYGWPSINSQFGIVDMCGFPKDNFFYYKAWWGKEPSLHLFPHWNLEGREGDEIPVWVYSNLDEVELFVNGKSLGSQKVPHLGHVEWKVKYEPGAIEARGSKDGKVVLTEKRETTGPAAAIRLTADRTEINADGEDVVDSQGGSARQGGPRRCRLRTT